MKLRTHYVVTIVLVAALVAAACGKDAAADQQAQEKAAIEAALMKYLGERGTINLAAMNVTIEDLRIAGDRVDAQVMFRTKQGEGEMRMAYVLMRQQGVWTVQAQPRSDMPPRTSRYRQAPPRCRPAILRSLRLRHPRPPRSPRRLGTLSRIPAASMLLPPGDSAASLQRMC